MLFHELGEQGRAELWATLALGRTPGIGATRRKALADFFGGAYTAVRRVGEWGAAALGLSAREINAFKAEKWRAEAKEDWEQIRDCRADIMLWTDQDYPALLKEIADAPLLLFCLGDRSLLRNPAVAVVGARHCTREGIMVAAEIVRGLSRAGVTTVSGMAQGIDRVVHLAGLEGVGGSIGVLGTGIDLVYPTSNEDLYRLMRQKGLLLSEFIPGTGPRRELFPIRNRLISGLSRAVLVVEAAMRSGTLITARHAAEQNREVFAVPGSSLAATSHGCRELIRRGAKPAFAADDILLELEPLLRENARESLLDRTLRRPGGSGGPSAEALLQDAAFAPGLLPWESKDAKRKSGSSDAELMPAAKTTAVDKSAILGLSELEHKILGLLQNKTLHVDELCRTLGMAVSDLSGRLTIMEIKGLVEHKPGMYYQAKL